MDLRQHLDRARQVHRAKAAERKATQRFILSWRGSEPEYVTGYSDLCARLKIKESTLRVRLSEGHGVYNLTRTNPTTGELDVLSITRLIPAKEPTKRGRPKKYIDLDRLGIEFSQPDDAPTWPRRKK